MISNYIAPPEKVVNTGGSFRKIKSLGDILAENRRVELYSTIEGDRRSHSLEIVFEDNKGISNDSVLELSNINDEIIKGIHSPT